MTVPRISARSGALRILRQWLVARGSDAALAIARCLSRASVDRIERLVAGLGPRLPVVGRNVAVNMRALGVYSPQAHRDYFANLAVHLAGALHVWRSRDPGVTGAAIPDALNALLHERVELDDSIGGLRELAARGRGVVLVGPHLSGYLLYLARLNQAVPLTAYMRPTRHERRRALQERWMRTVGLRRLVDPESGSNPVFVMAAAVRRGAAIYITPDLPQKREDGVAVRFFDREIYLPAGFALVARRAAAPLYFLTARNAGRVCRLGVAGPFATPPGGEERSSAARSAMQWFADRFSQFLVEQPGMWYFWADKRWTRVLAGDPRYSRSATQPPASGAGGG